MSGKYEAEYIWAMNHKTNPLAQNLITLAALYKKLPEHVTLAMIESTAADIRDLIADTPEVAVTTGRLRRTEFQDHVEMVAKLNMELTTVKEELAAAEKKLHPLACGHSAYNLVKGNVRRTDEGDCAICILHEEIDNRTAERDKLRTALEALRDECALMPAALVIINTALME